MEPPSPDRMQIVPDVDHPNGFASNGPQHIHISALQIQHTYESAFESVTGLHARPPIIPPTNPPSTTVAPPPEHGYDFIFHIGLAGRGPFRIERLAHKSGYRMKDSSYQYAPMLEFLPEPSALEPSQGEMLEQMRISSASMAIVGHASPVDAAVDHPVRGFGKGYEAFPEDLHTTIDVEHLVHAMKGQGVEVGSPSSLTLFFFSDLWFSFIHRWMPDTASATTHIIAPWPSLAVCLHDTTRVYKPRCFSCTVVLRASRSARMTSRKQYRRSSCGFVGTILDKTGEHGTSRNRSQAFEVLARYICLVQSAFSFFWVPVFSLRFGGPPMLANTQWPTF